MRRRAFLGVLGGVAAGWLLVQSAECAPLPTLGFIHSGVASAFSHVVSAFKQGLAETGYVEGQGVHIEFRWADNQLDRLPGLAADLVRAGPAAIVGNTLGARAAQKATKTIPIVVGLSNDLVTDGFVASYNRPGGNVTGVAFLSSGLGAKRLALLREVLPKGVTIGVLTNPELPATVADRNEVQDAARKLGQKVIAIDVTKVNDLDSAFASLKERDVGAVLVGGGPFMFSNRDHIVALATRYRLPSSYAVREFAAAGGLMSYGNSIRDAWRQAGTFAGRILKGEKPADMPVMQSNKFDFVINIRTAKSLGIEIHPQLIATADEVIE